MQDWFEVLISDLRNCQLGQGNHWLTHFGSVILKPTHSTFCNLLNNQLTLDLPEPDFKLVRFKAYDLVLIHFQNTASNSQNLFAFNDDAYAALADLHLQVPFFALAVAIEDYLDSLVCTLVEQLSGRKCDEKKHH